MASNAICTPLSAADVRIWICNMEEAVKGAKFILMSIPALAHEDYLRKLVPLLEDGMVIHTFPDNYASLLLRKFMREAGCNKDVIIGGWGSGLSGHWTHDQRTIDGLHVHRQVL